MEGAGPPCMPMDCLSQPHSGCSGDTGTRDSPVMLDEDSGEHVAPVSSSFGLRFSISSAVQFCNMYVAFLLLAEF
jgi:hypothetical protein